MREFRSVPVISGIAGGPPSQCRFIEGVAGPVRSTIGHGVSMAAPLLIRGTNENLARHAAIHALLNAGKRCEVHVLPEVLADSRRHRRDMARWRTVIFVLLSLGVRDEIGRAHG